MSPGEPPPPAVFLVNPASGRGRGEARLRALLARSDRAPSRDEIVPVRSSADVRAALRARAPGVIPVAVGGDGTVGLVAAALTADGRSDDTPLGILPLGTANILARTLGLADPGRALRALAMGRARRIDLMRTSRCEAPVALIGVSVGFEGRFIERYSALRGLGRPLAVLIAALGITGARSSITVEIDGKTLGPRALVGAGLYNTPAYAAGVVMSPGSDPGDGVAETVLYRTRRAYLATVLDGIRGGSARPRPGVVRDRWRRARLDGPGPVQIDGEPHPPGPVSVHVAPGALTVLSPVKSP